MKCYPVRAKHVVLACGGLGGLYRDSTNFPHITGDALGIAMKHQVVVGTSGLHTDPSDDTIFQKNREEDFLISESVRGEGALLLRQKRTAVYQ